MRILVVDNNMDQDCWGAEEIREEVASVGGTTVYVRRGPHLDLPVRVRSYDRIVVSGSRASCKDESPWVGKLDSLLRHALHEKVPVFAICYGHQALARILGGQDCLGDSPQPEVGWIEIEVADQKCLFRGLPKKFHTFSYHFEEVRKVPQGMRLLARSADCGIQALKWEEGPAWGIQFHPERSLAGGEKTIANCLKKKRPSVLFRPDQGKKLYDAEVSKTLFKNFLQCGV